MRIWPSRFVETDCWRLDPGRHGVDTHQFRHASLSRWIVLIEREIRLGRRWRSGRGRVRWAGKASGRSVAAWLLVSASLATLSSLANAANYCIDANPVYALAFLAGPGPACNFNIVGTYQFTTALPPPPTVI